MTDFLMFIGLLVCGGIWGFFTSLLFVRPSRFLLNFLGVVFLIPAVLAPFDDISYIAFSIGFLVVFAGILYEGPIRSKEFGVQSESELPDKKKYIFYWTSKGLRSKTKPDRLYKNSEIIRGEKTVRLPSSSPHLTYSYFTLGLDEIETIRYVDRKAIICCPECSQDCRVPRIATVEIVCPKCGRQWVQHLDCV